MAKKSFSSWKKQFRAEGKRPRAEPSRAENPSARAMARASSARIHHYCVLEFRKNSSIFALVLLIDWKVAWSCKGNVANLHFKTNFVIKLLPPFVDVRLRKYFSPISRLQIQKKKYRWVLKAQQRSFWHWKVKSFYETKSGRKQQFGGLNWELIICF